MAMYLNNTRRCYVRMAADLVEDKMAEGLELEEAVDYALGVFKEVSLTSLRSYMMKWRFN